jgi:hypothetical protein
MSNFTKVRQWDAIDRRTDMPRVRGAFYELANTREHGRTDGRTDCCNTAPPPPPPPTFIVIHGQYEPNSCPPGWLFGRLAKNTAEGRETFGMNRTASLLLGGGVTETSVFAAVAV